MVIADRLRVRELSGGRTITTVSDANIDAIILESDAVVSMHSGKYDWSISDPDFQVAKRASELIAASDIRKQFGDKLEEAQEQYAEAMKLLDLIGDKSSEVGGKAFMKRRPYKSWPASEYATPYLNDGYSASETTHLGDIISIS